MQTIHRTYETFEDARNVVARLEAEGVPSEQISLIGRNRTGDEGAAEGLALGGAIGGAGGLIAALTAVAVPGFVPLVAAGWLGSILIGAGTGAFAGGVIGALADAGVSRPDAESYAEALERGRSLVSVRTGEQDEPRIRLIMDSGMPVAAPQPPLGAGHGAAAATSDRADDIAGALS